MQHTADPRNVEGQLCRGVLQLREGQWADAKTSFEAALAVESRNPIALFGRGVARRRSGDNAATQDMNQADFDGIIGVFSSTISRADVLSESRHRVGGAQVFFSKRDIDLRGIEFAVGLKCLAVNA